MDGFRKLGEPLPARVVIFRALQLGDMLCAVPALRAVRAALPQAKIVLVGLPWAREFVKRYPEYLNGFREFPGYPGLPEREPQLARIPTFLAEMQSEQFDLAVQMHGNGSCTNALVAMFGARATSGFYVPGRFCPSKERFCPYPDQGLEIRRLLTLIEFLGMRTAGEELEFPIRARDYRALYALDGMRGVRPGEYVCMHPGASVAERRWPVERFAVVANVLNGLGYRIVLTGGGQENQLTQHVSRAVGNRLIDLAGQTDLGMLAALLEGSRLLICNDTGVSHLAAAVGVPSVVISTGDNPQRWAPNDSRRHRVLCSKTRISALEVLREAKELLREDAREPGSRCERPAEPRREIAVR